MNDKTLLVKSITLLYKESLLKDAIENSKSLVRTILSEIQIPVVNLGVNTDNQIIKELKEIALEMSDESTVSEYDANLILQRMNLIPYLDEKTTRALEDGFKDSENESNIKRSITILRKNLNNFFREQKIEDILTKQAYKFRHHRDQIRDVNGFIAEVVAQLEPLQLLSTAKDPAVVNEIDLGDEMSTTTVFNEIKELDNGHGILKTGWQALNRLTQGGFRRGETVCISALPHMYKTGVSLTLFKQIALYNEPYMVNVTKKPLILRISFEDDLSNNLQFLYANLKFNETLDPEMKMPNITSEEMSKYVKGALQINGYHIKMLRVDPSQWTYKNICNKVIELEAEGYEIHLLMLDYLAMVPTTGCVSSGATGTDIRDLFRRMRNFCSPKRIALITPHQLSTEAKSLSRSGIAPENFPKEIAEKGYYAGTKQLDQELDLDIYIHLVKDKKDVYLAFQRGKHRIPTIISEEDKYFLLKFPKGYPIPDDVNGKDMSYRKPGQVESAEELFSF
jgi:hypothetical protein